jgi:hypothetical protein
MNVYIFTGPTIAAIDPRTDLAAVYLPPASQGDVYRVARQCPRAIGIIDGCFEQVPAVWHKEILWAMSKGIHVFGSASMGALRAAELHVFGMIGVGEIFASFLRGELEDDDEVAVAHTSVQYGFRATSEAMVNIRFTMKAAKQSGISPRACDAIEQIAKSYNYPERTYERLLDRARAFGIPMRDVDALASWLPTGRVDQKLHDALAMLRTMRTFLASNPGLKRVGYTFERTESWEHFCATAYQSLERSVDWR